MQRSLDAPPRDGSPSPATAMCSADTNRRGVRRRLERGVNFCRHWASARKAAVRRYVAACGEIADGNLRQVAPFRRRKMVSHELCAT